MGNKSYFYSNIEENKNKYYKSPLIIPVFIFGFIYICMFGYYVVNYIIPEQLNDFYKPMKYALEAVGFSQTDYNVVSDSTEKKIKYTITATARDYNLKTTPIYQVLDKYVEYLDKHSNNKCNNDYKIDIRFQVEHKSGGRRGVFDSIEIRNYIEDNIHDGFDVVLIPLDYREPYFLNSLRDNKIFTYLIIGSDTNTRDITAKGFENIVDYFRNVKFVYINIDNVKSLLDIQSALTNYSNIELVNLNIELGETIKLRQIAKLDELTDIYIKEDGEYINYKIIPESCLGKNCLLIRSVPFDGVINFEFKTKKRDVISYEDSNIDLYLNSEIYNLFSDDVKTNMCEYEFEVENFAKESNIKSTNFIKRKVFLLSVTECTEFKKWCQINKYNDFFHMHNKNIWTRTLSSFRHVDCVCFNKLNIATPSYNTTGFFDYYIKDYLYFQPAFILNPEMEVELVYDILPGKNGFVLSCEK